MPKLIEEGWYEVGGVQKQFYEADFLWDSRKEGGGFLDGLGLLRRLLSH